LVHVWLHMGRYNMERFPWRMRVQSSCMWHLVAGRASTTSIDLTPTSTGPSWALHQHLQIGANSYVPTSQQGLPRHIYSTCFVCSSDPSPSTRSGVWPCQFKGR
jgi:hypothetical protein